MLPVQRKVSYGSVLSKLHEGAMHDGYCTGPHQRHGAVGEVQSRQVAVQVGASADGERRERQP